MEGGAHDDGLKLAMTQVHSNLGGIRQLAQNHEHVFQEAIFVC